MFSHASWSCKVFWCAAEGYFALLMIFEEVPIPSISLILLLKFLTLPLIVSGCLSGSNLIGLHMKKVEF